MPIFFHVAVVSDNDGSAFITKAEFDSLKNNFQAQIDNYNQSIDSKIDGAIAAYLAGIKIETGSDRLVIDWSRPFNDIAFGSSNVKYTDIIGTTPMLYDKNKGQCWYLGVYNSSENIYRVYRSLFKSTNRSAYKPDSVSFYEEQYYDTVDPMLSSHPIYCINVYNSTAATRMACIFRPGGRSWPALAYSDCTATGIQSLFPFEDEFGNVCYTYWNNCKQDQITNAAFIDNYWTEQTGMNVWIKYSGERSLSIMPKAWPILIATDGEGDIEFAYNAGDVPPVCTDLGLYQRSSSEYFFSADSRTYFAIVSKTTGTVIQYLTNQNGNILKDSYTAGLLKSVNGHIRAGEALVLFIECNYYPSSNNGTIAGAARLKMNFQNLNP